MASVWKFTNRKVKTVKNHKVTDQDEHFGTNPEKGRAKFSGKKMKKKKEGSVGETSACCLRA